MLTRLLGEQLTKPTLPFGTVTGRGKSGRKAPSQHPSAPAFLRALAVIPSNLEGNGYRVWWHSERQGRRIVGLRLAWSTQEEPVYKERKKSKGNTFLKNTLELSTFQCFKSSGENFGLFLLTRFAPWTLLSPSHVPKQVIQWNPP